MRTFLKFLTMKNYIYISILIILFLFDNKVDGQQLPIFNNPNTAAAIVNPALISMNYFKYDNNISTTLSYQDQWTGIADAPRTLSVGYEQLSEEFNLLFGGNIIHDQTGPISFTGVYGKGGYRINLSNNLSLTAALSVGVLQYRIKGNELNFLEAGDLASEDDMTLMPDFSLGAMLYGKNFYAGISVPQSFGSNLDYSKGENDFKISRVQHYYALAGGYLPLFNESWLEVYGWGKYVENVPFHLGVGVRYEYHENFYVGASYSTAKAVTFQTGVIFEVGDAAQKIDLGYAITNHFQSFGPQFGLSHDLRMSFSLASY